MTAVANQDYFALSATGLRRCSFEDHVRLSIRAALLTRRGEMTDHPELGSALWQFLFRPLTHQLKSELEREIRTTLDHAEPRIVVDKVIIQSDPKERTVFQIQVQYRIRGSERSDRLNVSLGGDA